MKRLALAALNLMVMAAPLLAQSDVASAVKTESKGIFSAILQIIVKWIFPVGAAYCFLHGILGKGVKRGEWDMAVLCTIAAIALALFPKLLATLFNVNLSEVLS